jgi:hypothetical protein
MRNFQSPGFPHNLAKKTSPEPKYGLYRCVSTSATIFDKKLGSKIIVEENVVILLYIPKHGFWYLMHLHHCASRPGEHILSI